MLHAWLVTCCFSLRTSLDLTLDLIWELMVLAPGLPLLYWGLDLGLVSHNWNLSHWSSAWLDLRLLFCWPWVRSWLGTWRTRFGTWCSWLCRVKTQDLMDHLLVWDSRFDLLLYTKAFFFAAYWSWLETSWSWLGRWSATCLFELWSWFDLAHGFYTCSYLVKQNLHPTPGLLDKWLRIYIQDAFNSLTQQLHCALRLFFASSLKHMFFKNMSAKVWKGSVEAIILITSTEWQHFNRFEITASVGVISLFFWHPSDNYSSPNKKHINIFLTWVCSVSAPRPELSRSPEGGNNYFIKAPSNLLE